VLFKNNRDSFCHGLRPTTFSSNGTLVIQITKRVGECVSKVLCLRPLETHWIISGNSKQSNRPKVRKTQNTQNTIS